MTERGEKRRRLSARTHAEAYDLWARHFADPALMANRDAQTTLRKLSRVGAMLPLAPDAAVLDVGPGDGTLFRILSGRVARCCGVDPSAAAVAKLTELLADLPNIELALGSATAIPYPDHLFDVVVINSVLQSLPSAEDMRGAMRELVRVCKPAGVVFVGELPFQSEVSKGLLIHLARKLRENGAANFGRLLWSVYARPVLRGEPILTYPATNLCWSADDFTAFCGGLGATVETTRHLELRRASLTRNDYRVFVGRTDRVGADAV
jgi:ubiquinone/menaquinone biosynthesis C-methylase UbiE